MSPVFVILNNTILGRLTFAVAADPKELDDHKQEEENSNPDTDINVVSPEIDSQTGSRDLER